MRRESERALLVIGLAFYWQVILNQVFPPAFLGTAAGGFGPRANYAVGVFLALLVLGIAFFFLGGHMRKGVKRRVVVGSLTFLYVASVVSFLAFSEGTLAYAVGYGVNEILYASLIFALTIFWSQVFDGIPDEECQCVASLSFACSVLIAFVGAQLASALHIHELRLQIIYPALAGVLLLVVLARNPNPSSLDEQGVMRPTLRVGKSAQLMACGILAMYLLFSSVYWSINTQGMGAPVEAIMSESSHRLLLLAMAVVFTLLVYTKPSVMDSHSYFITCFIALCIGALYVVALFWDSLTDVCNAVVLPTRAFAIFLFWLLLGVFARRHNLSFSLLAGSFFLPIVSVTWIVAYAFYGAWGAISGIVNPQTLMLVLVLLSAFILMIATFQYIARQRVDQVASVRENGTVQKEGMSPHALACEHIRRRFDLTDRETDVLMLLSEGHTKKKIAETLHVSVGSVQTYSKSLYAKLDVHSKQEIIDLVKEGIEEANVP